MTDLGAFIDAHPWVTFGAFLVAMQFAVSIALIGHRCSHKDDNA